MLVPPTTMPSEGNAARGGRPLTPGCLSLVITLLTMGCVDRLTAQPCEGSTDCKSGACVSGACVAAGGDAGEGGGGLAADATQPAQDAASDGTDCQPAGDDVTCDGVDDDCDAVVDEDCRSAIEAELLWTWVPGGNFDMGGGEPRAMPVHRVAVPGFAMIRAPVTNAQFDRCVEAGACQDRRFDVCRDRLNVRPPPVADVFRRADHPAACVTWQDAHDFSAWLGRGARLPSEAEWEFAARAGDGRQFPWGSEPADCRHAVITEPGGELGCGFFGTGPVCSRGVVNGFCDLAGNVFEWMADSYHDDYTGAPVDGSPWNADVPRFRSTRGGSWDLDSGHSTTRLRRPFPPEQALDFVGFRLVRPAE